MLMRLIWKNVINELKQVPEYVGGSVNGTLQNILHAIFGST